MHGIGDIGTTEPAELRVQGLLHLIRQTHVEHAARIAMSTAMHQAEVVVIGRGDHELAGRVAKRLDLCGGRLAATISPDTRFAVRAPRATTEDIDAAGVLGVAVIDESEFDRMVEVYASHTGREQVRAAARRALETNRIASSVRAGGAAVPSPRTAGRRMATNREEALKRRVPETLEPASEDEQELERHARNVRGLNASTPFRHQRQPLVQPS